MPDQIQNYFSVPPSIVSVWNTKRLLPPVLLSQYTPFSTLFIIQDDIGNFLSTDIIDEANALILGSPIDTVFNQTHDYYNDPSNFESINTNSITSSTLYYKNAKENQYRLFSLGSFNAVIKGIVNGSNTKHKLIPLTTKLSQLVQPDGKNIIDMSNCSVRIKDTSGYIEAQLGLDSHNIHQLFSQKSVISKIFQNFTKYLLIIGWQGPTLEEFQMQFEQGNPSSTITQVSNNHLKIKLLDDSEFDLLLPTPFVKLNGELNLPLNDSGDAYVFDIDDVDNGNRMVIPLFGTIPQVSFQGTKISFSFNATSAFQGKKMNESLSLLFGGSGFETIRAKLIDILNEIKPIASFDIKTFFEDGKDFDAEEQQAVAESFYNNIKNKDGLGTGTKTGIGTSDSIKILDKDPTQPDQKISDVKDTAKKTVEKNIKKVTNKTSLNLTYLDPNGVNLNLTDSAKKLLNRLDAILGKNNFTGTLTSGVRSGGNPNSHHNHREAIDVVFDQGNKKVADFLQDNSSETGINSTKILYETKGQIAGGFKSTGEHVHITLIENSSENDSTDDSNPGENLSIENDPQHNDDQRDIQAQEDTTSQTVTFDKRTIKEVPAAYRLGDIITAILDVVDNILTPGRIEEVKIYLSKAKLQKVLDKDIKDLTETDVFDSSGGKTNYSSFKKDFKNDVQNQMDAKKFVNHIHSSDFDWIGLEHYLKNSSNMSDTVGYDIVSKNISDEQTKRWKSCLEIFRDNSCGQKYTEIEEKIAITKFPSLFKEMRTNIFKWSKDYDKFNSDDEDFPITVADLPVSTDSFSRILQTLVYSKTCNDIINNIITTVSNDYGFTIRMFHRTPGSQIGNVTTDFTNFRSNFKKTLPAIDEKIMFIIDDEFLTDERMIEDLKKQSQENLESLDNVSTGKTNPTGISSLFNQKMTGIESKDISSLLLQDKILLNEYSKKKMNNVFILDYGSINSLVKQITFSTIDGGRNFAQQQIIMKMYDLLKNVNGSTVPIEVTEGQKKLSGNLSDIFQNVGNYVQTQYKIMPGNPDFEIKYLKIISEVMESLNGDNSKTSDLFFKDENVKPKLDTIRSELEDKKTFVKDEDRKQFLNAYISSYIYNRPLGVKFSFYLGKISATIHGTTGLGIMNGLYIRGTSPQLEGFYRITSVQHNIGTGGFETQIEAILIASNILNETNKLLGSTLLNK